MKNIRLMPYLVAAAGLALGGLGIAATAQAGTVVWAVGVSSPGIQVGVSNTEYRGTYSSTYVQPFPVHVQPHPVYVVPYPVVYGRPVPLYENRYPHAPVEWRHAGPLWRDGHLHHHRHHAGGYYRHGGHDGDDGYDGRHSGHRR